MTVETARDATGGEAQTSEPKPVAEARLRRREAELSRAQRLSRLGSFEVHIGGGAFQTHYSPEYLALHGLGPEAAREPHDAWVQRVHPEDRERAASAFFSALAGRDIEHEHEYRIVRSDDGTVRWIKALVEIERNSAGQPTHLFGTHRDVTDRKLAEIASAESNRLVSEFMAVFPGVLYVYDLKSGRNVFMNSGSVEATGFSPEEVAAFDAEAIASLVHPDDVARLTAHRAAFERLPDGETAVVEYRTRHKDGRWRWFFSRELVYRRDDAGAAWQVLGIATDITERKTAEETLERTRDRLRLALKGARAGTWEWRRGEAGSTWSADLRAIAGLALDGVGPSPAEAMAMVAPEGHIAAREAALDILRRGGPFAQDLKLRRPDGRMVWLSVTGTIDHDDAGQPERAYGIAQDITERKLHEEQVALLMREVNHRANNLLGVVQGIARQTVASRPDDFLPAFRGRIQSLAVNQRLLVESEWRGVGLHELVLGQTAPFVETATRQLTIEGPALRLKPAAAQAIGMALHELASNAASHGALSTPHGSISIDWRLDDNFAIHWTERGGPPVTLPQRKGFGSAVILSMVKVSISGEVELDYASTGLQWRLECPAVNVLEPEP